MRAAAGQRATKIARREGGAASRYPLRIQAARCWEKAMHCLLI
jgi:hypothetical protein